MDKLKYTSFKQTKIWKILEEQLPSTALGKIESILNNIVPLLKETKRVFPTYTNHDGEHSLKIIETIEILLKDKYNVPTKTNQLTKYSYSK